VLVVDDNADVRDYVRRLLNGRHQILTAVNGQDGLAIALRHRPDVVLTDITMPIMDGMDLLRELRARPETSTTPVILLSARAGEESRSEGMDAGADDYLIKPFSARELTARVGAHLQMARVRRSTEETLRESEKKYRELFESMIEAYCVIEIIFDRNQNPVDFRYVETNRAFVQHATRPDVGRAH